MPTTRSEERHHRPARRRATCLVAALTLFLPAGCTSGGEPSRPRGDLATAASGDRDVVRDISALLDRRAVAVRRADRAAYDAGVGGRSTAPHEQERWFDNVAQLPRGFVGFALDASSLIREGGRPGAPAGAAAGRQPRPAGG